VVKYYVFGLKVVILSLSKDDGVAEPAPFDKLRALAPQSLVVVLKATQFAAVLPAKLRRSVFSRPSVFKGQDDRRPAALPG
jgi:hypothetical protein